MTLLPNTHIFFVEKMREAFALVKCFMTLLPNTHIFFVEKMREAFALQNFSHFFNKKYWHIQMKWVLISCAMPSEPGCSKLTMLLINVLLKFQTLIS